MNIKKSILLITIHLKNKLISKSFKYFQNINPSKGKIMIALGSLSMIVKSFNQVVDDQMFLAADNL